METFECNLIIIGGAEDKKGKMEILQEVCSKINKEKDELIIATVATEHPQEVGAEYNNIFKNMNVRNVSILNVESREDAVRQDNLNLIQNANLIFFTGGDQLRITSILGGTPLYSRLKQKFEEGCIFVGTSAGASVMSDTMIVKGLDEESPKKCTLKMAPGLGLIKGVIIDQHFAQRGRIGRLLVGIAENPQSLGVGIDEDTAIVVNNNKEFKVIGSGAVYVVDGSGISHSNVSEQYQDELLSIFDVKMHVLKKGNIYNFKVRKPYKDQVR